MGRLDHLVEAVYDRFKDRYFENESTFTMIIPVAANSDLVGITEIFVDVQGDKYVTFWLLALLSSHTSSLQILGSSRTGVSAETQCRCRYIRNTWRFEQQTPFHVHHSHS